MFFGHTGFGNSYNYKTRSFKTLGNMNAKLKASNRSAYSFTNDDWSKKTAEF